LAGTSEHQTGIQLAALLLRRSWGMMRLLLRSTMRQRMTVMGLRLRLLLIRLLLIRLQLRQLIRLHPLKGLILRVRARRVRARQERARRKAAIQRVARLLRERRTQQAQRRLTTSSTDWQG
jgi:hypothetical protein